MVKKSGIPTGSEFLPGTSKKYLQEARKREADPKAANRLLAYIKRKERMSIRRIGSTLELPYSTVRGWLVRAVRDGIAGRYDEQIPGRPCKLDERQLEQLKEDLTAGPQACGFGSGVWTAPLVVIHVRKKYGVEYVQRGMYDLLVRLGFSCRKPRPRHPDSASESEREEFKKKLGPPSGITPRRNTG